MEEWTNCTNNITKDTDGTCRNCSSQL